MRQRILVHDAAIIRSPNVKDDDSKRSRQAYVSVPVGTMSAFAAFLQPYEFSPTVVLICIVAVIVYARGFVRSRREGAAPARGPAIVFFAGVALMYAVLQTQYDYMAQHMFFLHRVQHLVLHHVAPVLIVLAAPGPVLAAGLPPAVRVRARAFGAWRPLRVLYRTVQQPVVATVLFAGLIYLWLMPAVHFYAMLNLPLYNIMNWSMAIDGLLFWYLMLGPRRPRDGGVAYGWRVLILAFLIPPQDLIGAWISLSRHEIYEIYGICGRLWPISPLTDQQLGGLITWIPGAMMSVLGGIVVLRRWVREDDDAHRTARVTNAGEETADACT